MTTIVSTFIAIICSIILTGSNTAFAQNTTNQASASINSSSIAKPTVLNSTGIAKLHLEEAIKALENGSKQAVSTRLTAALQGVAQSSNETKMHFNEAIKAFSAGNTNDTLLHLKAATENLK
jgi:hypothetical protein